MSKANEPKIGAGHAGAMWRQGLSELRGALYNEGNVAQPPQYGLYGTRTPGEVAADRRDDAAASPASERDEEPNSKLKDRIEAAQTRQPERDQREMDRD